eukprot:CAMPEP_0172023712 /NCGR_PEP_ID=MMETSP1041-20130122/14932_1 /TAXON_ID=464988 /ORGANISM="Hemiselmis andersenii, Strain CCMP439" /LENGTH=51 /DNA_ID=CAMNT_0012679203 /DNA_START=1451 /DNA_END=1606 /DNA_ORIENTATION=+
MSERSTDCGTERMPTPPTCCWSGVEGCPEGSFETPYSGECEARERADEEPT